MIHGVYMLQRRLFVPGSKTKVTLKMVRLTRPVEVVIPHGQPVGVDPWFLYQGGRLTGPQVVAHYPVIPRIRPVQQPRCR